MLTEVVLPACRDNGMPFAMMIGVKKQVNPMLGDAGDSMGLSSWDRSSGCAMTFRKTASSSPFLLAKTSMPLCSGSQVREPFAVRMLVVHEQPVVGLGDDNYAAGDARN